VLVLDATYSNAVTRTFTWGLDLSGTLQGAGGIGGLLRLDDTDDVYFYTCDANGNVSELIDDSGNTDAHYEYTPFGSQVVATGPCAAENPFRFSTKYREEEIELYYYGFRYYSPRLGRWLNRDPLLGQAYASGVLPGAVRRLNVTWEGSEYAFCNSNPIGTYDLLGLCVVHLNCVLQNELGDCHKDYVHKCTEPPPYTRRELPWTTGDLCDDVPKPYSRPHTRKRQALSSLVSVVRKGSASRHSQQRPT
jgi:RHS repeat-associated protein